MVGDLMLPLLKALLKYTSNILQLYSYSVLNLETLIDYCTKIWLLVKWSVKIVNWSSSLQQIFRLANLKKTEERPCLKSNLKRKGGIGVSMFCLCH